MCGWAWAWACVCAVIPSAATLESTTFFEIIPHTARFSAKKLLNVKCMFWFSLQTLFETFLILRRIQRDIIINLQTRSCKVHIILVGFNWNSNSIDRFSKKKKKPKYQIALKSIEWELSCSMRTDRWTDMAKLIFTFRDFANAPKN
jgi:hypothetical protein